MNRFTDYKNLKGSNFKCIEKNLTERPFYDTFDENLYLIKNKLNNLLSYKKIRILEDEFNKLILNITDMFNKIHFTDINKDTYSFIIGIKDIINFRISKLQLQFHEKKSFYTKTIILEPEYSKGAVPDKKNIYIYKNLQKQQPKVINQTEKISQQLQEIEGIQDLITLQLNLQNENISDILSKNLVTKENVEKSEEIFKYANEMKEFKRGFLIIYIYCLIFVLMYLFYFYR